MQNTIKSDVSVVTVCVYCGFGYVTLCVLHVYVACVYVIELYLTARLY